MLLLVPTKAGSIKILIGTTFGQLPLNVKWGGKRVIKREEGPKKEEDQGGHEPQGRDPAKHTQKSFRNATSHPACRNVDEGEIQILTFQFRKLHQ